MIVIFKAGLNLLSTRNETNSCNCVEISSDLTGDMLALIDRCQILAPVQPEFEQY